MPPAAPIPQPLPPVPGSFDAVDTLAALKLRPGRTDGERVSTAGIAVRGDNAGGEWYWDAASTATPDDGVVVQVTGVAVGRYFRLIPLTVDVRWFGAKADTGVTDNTAAFTAAFNAANANRGIVVVPYPGVGNEYWFAANNAALPALTTARGIRGDRGSTSIMKFNRDGDCVIVKGGGKLVQDLEIDNVRTTVFSARSACVRLQNWNYGLADNLAANCGASNCDNVVLEQVYDGSAEDAEMLVHTGVWYNRLRGLKLNYLSVGTHLGYGLTLAVNPSAVGVVNPTGQPAGTYTGNVSYNTVMGLNTEDREHGIHLDRATANTVIGGQILGCGTSVYGRRAQGNNFIGFVCNLWTKDTGAAFDIDSVTSRCNMYDNVTFFNSDPQPWPLGLLGATADDIIGAVPIWSCTADGISPSVFTGLYVPRGGTVGGVEMRGNNVHVPAGGYYARADNAGAAMVLESGRSRHFGEVVFQDAIGNYEFERSLGSVADTTTAIATDIASFQLPSNSAILIEFTSTGRRTGGSRGTGAVGDLATFIWRAAVKMVGTNTGTPAIVGVSALSDAAYIDADLLAAGVSVGAPTTGTNGIVKVTATAGSANLNLHWVTKVKISAVST